MRMPLRRASQAAVAVACDDDNLAGRRALAVGR
jgi:hypothetical protein